MKILIVGGGIGGMSSAITLRKLGLAVDVIDRDPDWRVYGAGMTITRPTMRAFRDLGILDELITLAYDGDGIRICEPNGTYLRTVPDPQIPGEPLPGSGGIMRPDLHRVLSRRTLQSGANVRLGVTVATIDDRGESVHVTFSDGSSGDYDLVIGADGVFSQIRSMIFPNADRPEFTGQFIWRLMADRPPEFAARHYFLGGQVKVGISPVSESSLYLFALEHAPLRPPIPEQDLHEALGALLKGFGGIVGKLAQDLNSKSSIIVRPLASLLLPPPWYSGRILLVGDAAHPTTPHLASGAGIAIEDGLVLAEELQKAGYNVPTALRSFMDRRWERCRAVVENSIEIGRREQAGSSVAEQTTLVDLTLAKLAKPI